LPAAAKDKEQAVGTHLEIASARSKDVVPGSNVAKDRFPESYRMLRQIPGIDVRSIGQYWLNGPIKPSKTIKEREY
jgi:hypothetical protein